MAATIALSACLCSFFTHGSTLTMADADAGVPVGAGTIDDQFWSLGVADQLAVAEGELLPVNGTLPSWLVGRYILGGPTQFSVGGRKLNHLFDGLARISSFTFNGSESVSFSSRMMDSKWYNNSMKANDVAPQFLMNKTTPPRLADELPLLNAEAPNDNNIVFPLRMNASTYWHVHTAVL